jgi:hypothetical protein
VRLGRFRRRRAGQEVLSANAIGYIKRELPAGGQLITVAVPL